MITFIGCGNMGEAILKGILESSFLNTAQVVFYEKDALRRDYIAKTYGISASVDICSSVKGSKYLLIAVKPQNIKHIIDEIGRCFRKDINAIISIAAGISTQFYENNLGEGASIMRVMPNAPALYKKGMATISRGKYADNEVKDFTVDLMGKIGETILIDEDLQNISTAINGSGPAYFFLFCKALIGAAIMDGLDEKAAKKLVIETMIGAGDMMKRSDSEIDELISKVASPGGTTEQALKSFNNSRLNDIVGDAVRDAVRRSIELGKQTL